MASSPLLKRLLVPQRPRPAVPVSPGLHPFHRETDSGLARFHLRVDRDGAGLLLANASAAIRLGPPGVVMALRRLSGRDDASIVREVRSRFTGASKASIRADLARVDALIAELASPRGAYPVLNLDDPALPHHEAELIAPLVADLPVTALEQVRPLVERLWRAAIPQVTFVAGDATDPTQLWQAVERAEDTGMVAGVRAPGALLAREGLLERLAEAGLDHVTVYFAAAEPAIHDDLMSAGDHAAALQVFAQARELEICTVAQVPLLERTVPPLGNTFQAMVEAGVRTTAFFAVATPEEQPTDGALPAAALRQVAASVEEAASEVDARYFWQPPVERNANVPLAAQVRAGPRCSGDLAVRVLPDGTVIPPRGPWRDAGNLLSQSWDEIWAHGAFRLYRERVQAPTRCEQCPGLAICAADCPAQPAGWSSGDPVGAPP
jgi:radical SAM protein with 4Fe4S-binding SPASM domain